MTEIKLEKRYPHSRTEDITDAFMRGYQQGKEDEHRWWSNHCQKERVMKWTPCSERLPERDGNYLIQVNFEWGAEFEIGEWSNGMWWNDNRHVNVAWMPLPEPYDAEQTEPNCSEKPNKCKDEPQFDRDINVTSKDEPQTDCAWK